MPSGSAELMTTWDSRTGMSSPSSILRCCADGDVGADLDGAALVVEEPEAVAAAGGLQRAGLGDEPDAVGGQAAGQRVDVGGVRGTERDQVDPLVGRLAQPDDVLLRAALGGQEGQARVAVLGGQAPGVGVEVELLGVVGHGEVDVPQVGDQALGHGAGPCCARSAQWAFRRAGCVRSGCAIACAHEAGDVALLVVELPLGELVGGVDDGLGAVEPAGGKASHRSWSTRVALVSSSARTTASSRACAPPWARVGGQVCAASPMSTTRPRFHGDGEHVGLEPGVVHPGRVGERLADLVPRAVVGRRRARFIVASCSLRGQGRAVLGLLDDVGVERVLAGGAVAGDEGGAAVVEVGAGDARRPRAERPPDAHADRLGLQLDAERAPGPGPDAVGADDEVVAAGRAVGEGDVDAVAVLRELGVRRAEPDLDADLGGPVEQDPGQVRAGHAHRRRAGRGRRSWRRGSRRSRCRPGRARGCP